jgi:hypothetical protein
MRPVGLKIWMDRQTNTHTCTQQQHDDFMVLIVFTVLLCLLCFPETKIIPKMASHIFYAVFNSLSARAEYMYSTASHASCPDGVLILCDFHKVIKSPGTVDFKV